MPFDARTTSSGGLIVGHQTVTIEDGIAALALTRDHGDWRHLVIDVSMSVSPFALPRNEELDGLHLLARTARDLRLPKGFKIAIVRGARSGGRVADFVDLAQSIAVDLQVEAFDSRVEALTWVDATVTNS